MSKIMSKIRGSKDRKNGAAETDSASENLAETTPALTSKRQGEKTMKRTKPSSSSPVERTTQVEEVNASRSQPKKFESILFAPICSPAELHDWLSTVVTLVTARYNEMSSVNDILRTKQLELDQEVEKLLLYRREAAETTRDLERIVFQIASVNKLKKETKMKLRSSRAEEENKYQELAEASWKPLRSKWLSLKTKRNQAELRKFIEEAREKQKGLEVLADLAQARLNRLSHLARKRQTRTSKLPKPIKEKDGDDGDASDEYESDPGTQHRPFHLHIRTLFQSPTRL